MNDITIDPYRVFLAVGRKIRVADMNVKSWKHDWHNFRLSSRSAPSADRTAPLFQVLKGNPKGIKASIKDSLDFVLKNYGVKPCGKSSTLVAELVISVGSNYFGGQGYQSWDNKKVQAWKTAVLKMLEKNFGDRIVAIIYHQDESAPHFHVYVMPLVAHKSTRTWNPNGRKARYSEGQLKLSSRAFFTRKNMIHWQDEYGLAVQHLGLLRGERGSTATHRKMRDAQRDLEKELAEVKERVSHLQKMSDTANMVVYENEELYEEAKAQKKSLEERERKLREEEEKLTKRKAETAAEVTRLDSGQMRLLMEAKKVEALKAEAEKVRESLTEREKGLRREEREQLSRRSEIEAEASLIETDRKNLRELADRLRVIPIEQVIEKLGFKLDDSEYPTASFVDHTNTEFKYRIVRTEERFKVECYRYKGAGNFIWEKVSEGKGAIDVMLPFTRSGKVTEACERLAEMFPESAGGIVVELLGAQNPKMWKELAVNIHSNIPSALAAKPMRDYGVKRQEQEKSN